MPRATFTKTRSPQRKRQDIPAARRDVRAMVRDARGKYRRARFGIPFRPDVGVACTSPDAGVRVVTKSQEVLPILPACASFAASRLTPIFR